MLACAPGTCSGCYCLQWTLSASTLPCWCVVTGCSWAEAAGAVVEGEQGVEISPLVSYAGEGLEAACAGATFDKPFDLALQGASSAATGKPSTNMGPWLVPVAVAYAGVTALTLTKAAAGK